jgi:hypothetical protein
MIAALGLYLARRRRITLLELARAVPELHPALAYLTGSLRHEFLKHRVATIGEALRGMSGGQASESRRLLLERLYQGEPLDRAFAVQLRTLERMLGPRFKQVRRDPAFQDVTRALARLGRLEPAVRAGRPHALRGVKEAHAALKALDHSLRQLTGELARTQVDRALLEEAVATVREEYGPSQVALDELSIATPEPGLAVEVFRTDMLLILRNLLRNAVVAVGRSPAPRRIALDVRVDVEPTGDEVIRLRISDTSPEALDVPSRVSPAGGLGLVVTALARYDGALEVASGPDGYQKTACVRLFRSLLHAPADGALPALGKAA